MSGTISIKRKFLPKSLFFKWIIIFSGLVIISHLITAVLSVMFIMPTFYKFYNERLYNKAVLLKGMYEQNLEISEDVLAMTGDSDITMLLSDDGNLSGEYKKYGEAISLNMVRRAMDGEIVSSYLNENISSHGFSIPYAMVAVGDEIALLVPKAKGSEISVVVTAYRNILLMNALLVSIFISGALRIFISPIRKVSDATHEVSKGNFDIKLESNSEDEVGQLIRNFNYMTEALQKNEYLKKDFVSSVSHEFKTPITSVEGFARLIKDEHLTKNQLKEYAGIIIRESQRLSRLSSNLLTLTVLESSRIETVSAEFYLDEQIRNVILLLENLWAEKNIEFNIEMDELLIHNNEELLAQVWINLLHNAIKFSPSGGQISVTAVKDNDKIRVTIADKGIGIAPDSLSNVFDRFYKADRSRTRDGNGLGLSIVKRILELTGGTISIESKEGRGTTVHIVLSVPFLKPF